MKKLFSQTPKEETAIPAKQVNLDTPQHVTPIALNQINNTDNKYAQQALTSERVLNSGKPKKLNSSEDDNDEEFYKASPSPTRRDQEQRNGGANILVQNAEIRSQSSTFKRDEKQYAAAM